MSNVIKSSISLSKLCCIWNLLKNIYNYSKNENITTFISTQKASTLKLCDKIIVLDKFKIVAFDTPKKLSKTSNLYKNLINKQERSL